MDRTIAVEIAGLLLLAGYLQFTRWVSARSGMSLPGLGTIVAGMLVEQLALIATTSSTLLAYFGQGFLVGMGLLGLAASATAVALVWIRRRPERALTAGSWLFLLGVMRDDHMATSTPFLHAVKSLLDAVAIAAWAVLAFGAIYLAVQQRRRQARAAADPSRQDITPP